MRVVILAAALAKRAMNLTYVGGTWGAHRRPTPFLCLLLKMLMIQPEMAIVEAFLSEKDFRYVRLLGAFYVRLVGTGEEVYKCLETLYADNRKFKFRQLDGTYVVDYIDNFIDNLLTTTRVCDTTLPPLVSRKVLTDRGKLGKRVSLLDDLLAEEESDVDSGDELATRHIAHSDSESDETSRARARRRDDSSEDERGRRREISSSPNASPRRSLSTKRAGFRSPSPDHRFTGSNNDDHSPIPSPRGRDYSPPPRSTSPAKNGTSPTDTRESRRSPEARPTRGARSPDTSPRPSRGNRSPDVPPSELRRGNRSPDVDSSRRRGDRSPDTRDTRYDSPRRSRGDRSPDNYRGRRNESPRRDYDRRSPERRYEERDRDYRRRDYDERRSGYDDRRDYRRRDDYGDDRDYSKKRSRHYEEDRDEDEGRYPSSKKPKYHESESNKPKSSGSRGGGGGGGKAGGLREMSVDQMNELRKSIGLGPLKS